MKLQPGHLERRTHPDLERRRARQGAVKRGQDDDPAVDPVIADPGRIGGGDLAFEGGLASRGIAADAEEGMPGGRRQARRRGRGPVALAFEGIVRDRDPAPGLAPEQAGQGGFGPLRPGLPGRGHEPAAARTVEAGDEGRGRRSFARIPQTLCERPEDRTGAELDHEIGPPLRQSSDARRERDPLAGMAAPVGPVRRCVQDPAGHVAHQRHRGRVPRQPVSQLPQLVEDRIHQRAVEPAARVEAPDPDPRRLQRSGQGIDRRRRPTDHEMRPVVGGDRQTR